MLNGVIRSAYLIGDRPRLRGSISPALVDSLASAITNQEGYFPGSVAFRNNNPGNLIYVGQSGAVAGDGGFARFPTPEAGAAALRSQISLDLTRGTDAAGRPTTTIAELISSWAPASDGNDTASYIANVSAALGIDPDTPLDGAAAGDDGFDLPAFGTVDLSAVGLPSSVPVALVAGVSLAAVLLFSRR